MKWKTNDRVKIVFFACKLCCSRGLQCEYNPEDLPKSNAVFISYEVYAESQ